MPVPVGRAPVGEGQVLSRSLPSQGPGPQSTQGGLPGPGRRPPCEWPREVFTRFPRWDLHPSGGVGGGRGARKAGFWRLGLREGQPPA